MKTRELKNSELDDLLALYAHMHISDDPLPERRVVEDIWQEIQGSNTFLYFGTFSEWELVSSCTLSVIPNLSRGCRPYGVIENVVTNTSCRRKGYGSAVMTHALTYAWQRECYKVMLMTGRKTKEVYRFYESLGFDQQKKQAFLAVPEGR